MHSAVSASSTTSLSAETATRHKKLAGIQPALRPCVQNLAYIARDERVQRDSLFQNQISRIAGYGSADKLGDARFAQSSHARDLVNLGELQASSLNRDALAVRKKNHRTGAIENGSDTIIPNGDGEAHALY